MSDTQINEIPERNIICKKCYYKNNEQISNIWNECTQCLFNTSTPKTNNFTPLPTAKKLA